MTKLKKVNEHTGPLEDVYPNLIIVGGKSVAVPVDKQHVVKNMGAEIGDTVWIRYDGRGYLLEAVLERRAIKNAIETKKASASGKETEKELWIDSSSQIGKGYLACEAEKATPVSNVLDTAIKNYRTPTELRERLIVLQSMCKLGAEVFAITNLTTVQPEDFEQVMDLIIARAIKDTETIMKAGGSS
jgi:hypothetical protein